MVPFLASYIATRIRFFGTKVNLHQKALGCAVLHAPCQIHFNHALHKAIQTLIETTKKHGLLSSA